MMPPAHYYVAICKWFSRLHGSQKSWNNLLAFYDLLEIHAVSCLALGYLLENLRILSYQAGPANNPSTAVADGVHAWPTSH